MAPSYTSHIWNAFFVLLTINITLVNCESIALRHLFIFLACSFSVEAFTISSIDVLATCQAAAWKGNNLFRAEKRASSSWWKCCSLRTLILSLVERLYCRLSRVISCQHFSQTFMVSTLIFKIGTCHDRCLQTSG